MTTNSHLVVGKFYWVIPEPDPERVAAWEDDV